MVTHDRPACLAQCLQAIHAQTRPPDLVIVVDNASGPATWAVVSAWPEVVHAYQPVNRGGAAGYAAGIAAALARDAAFVWLMDDDGRPASPDCLAVLLARAEAGGGLVAPLVLDEAMPTRLAFPIRLRGRTVFDAAPVVAHGPLAGFAHLFNGALVGRAVFAAIGLPDARFFIRGDEVDFLVRARRAGIRVALDPQARFLHPGSNAEIHPILFGRFYAVVPTSPTKQFYLFRNRAFIFRRYGMWVFLAADVVRYAAHFLVEGRGDVGGFARWCRATATGLHGRFMREEGATP